MKKNIYRICLFIITLLFTNALSVSATHMIGGDITYVCLGGNNYRVTITLFLDCKDGEQIAIDADNYARYAIYVNDPGKTLYTSDDVYREFRDTVPPEFSNECVSNFPYTCLLRSIHTFNVNLPPNEFGYTIVYQRCCRNESINNINNPGNVGITYSAVIPPQSAATCNNSVYFDNMPPQIICSNYPFSYSFAATDVDGDSLVYRLCESYLGGSTSNPIPEGANITPPPFPTVNYKIGYTYDDPLPAFPPLNIDPSTGLMTMQPTANGRFQVKVCVDEYRDGILINTLSRDLQFLIFNCNKLVVANTPLHSTEFNTYMVNCESYEVKFENTSTGGFSYIWDFGDGSPTSTDFEPTHNYADTGVYTITLIVNPGTTCEDSIKRLVKIYPYFTTSFTKQGELCPGEEITFNGQINSTNPNDEWQFYWNFGDGTGDSTQNINPKHTYDSGGVYEVELYAINKYGCEYTAYDTIEINSINTNAGNDTMVVLGYDFQLNGTGAEVYHWSPSAYLSDPNIANPSVAFPSEGEYTYVLTGSAGDCISSDTVNIIVVKEPSILMPNAFSPNADGLNDFFKPVIVGYPYMNYLRLYDRWGNLVFLSYKVQNGWDGNLRGKKAEQGVYFWEISVKDIKGEDVYLKGDVTLLR